MPADDHGLTDDQGVPLLTGTVTWTCPNCWTEETTAAYLPNRFHSCPGLHGLTAPLVRAGTRCKVVAYEREDWQRREMTQDGDDGRPYMQVVTTRDDGQDVAILAPCAQMYG